MYLDSVFANTLMPIRFWCTLAIQQWSGSKDSSCYKLSRCVHAQWTQSCIQG